MTETKRKMDVAEIERKLNKVEFEKKLDEFIARTEAENSRSITDILEPYRTKLLAARRAKATLKDIAAFLDWNGIPIPESALRQYLGSSRRKKKSSE